MDGCFHSPKCGIIGVDPCPHHQKQFRDVQRKLVILVTFLEEAEKPELA
jgi:hypothetical protein